MTNLVPVPSEDSVIQIETTTRVLGGVDAVDLPFVKWSAPSALGRIGLAVAGGTELVYVTDNGFLNIPAANLFNAANDVAAAALGVPANGVYRNGSVLQVRVT